MIQSSNRAMKIGMSVQSYMLYHTANFQPMKNSQSRYFNCRTLILQLSCRQTVLKNINRAQVRHYKLGLLITWASENYGIGYFSWREYNSIVWAHDESQDVFGKFSKIGTWKFWLEKVSKSNFWQMYRHMKVYRWVLHDLRTDILQGFSGHNKMV